MFCCAALLLARAPSLSQFSSNQPSFRRQFTEVAKFDTAYATVGALTVLSPSTVAMSLNAPGQIGVWDWKAGKCLWTLSGFDGGAVFANAVLPDGRLVTGDSEGTIRVGSVDNWTAAKVIANGSKLLSVLAGQDGSFITTDFAGKIKLWRNGACELTLNGACTDYYNGVPTAVIGSRLVAVGNAGNLLVAE